MNARMEDTRDMVATFNPNTPPPLDGPSPRSPRRASAAAYAPAAPAAAAAAALPDEYDPRPDEIARFREFTGSSELDARIELRLSKRLGKTFMEAVSYYAENHVEMATPTADAAAAAPVPITVGFDSASEDNDDDGHGAGFGSAAADLAGVFAVAPGTARPAAPAPIVARGGSDEATNFMEITGSSRATALRILRGSRLRGKSYEDAVTYYFEIGQDVFSTDDAADASGAGALGAGVVDSDFDMADSSDEEYGGGGAAAAPAPASAEDVAPMGYFASAATAVSGLMARIGGASYDDVAARRREAAAAAAAAAPMPPAPLTRAPVVPVWPTAAPLEVRRYATQLFEHSQQHSHDTGSRPSTATYIAQMKTTCTNWRHAFTGASTFAKDRNVDAFMRVFQENLEAASGSAAAVSTATRVGASTSTSAGVAHRTRSRDVEATTSGETPEVQQLMSVTQKSARACRIALRVTGNDVAAAIDNLIGG